MEDELNRLQDVLSDRYEVEREIGKGGMAMVYLALDRKHGRKVAIKVLDRTLASTIGAERFHREIRIAAGLTHPHILQIHDSGGIDDLLYYVMPYVGDATLMDRIRKETQLPIEAVVSIAREVASALDFAHDAGVIHRDVKPANILLTAGHATLADFGIARILEPTESGGATAAGVVMGTTSYMSPEQATGAAIDRRSDVYALACVTYEMLSGDPPFGGENPMAVLAHILTEDARPIDVVRKTATPELAAVIRKGLARAPEDRYATAGDFAMELAEASSSIAEAPPRPGPARAARPTAPGRVLRWIAVVAASIGGVWLAGQAVLNSPGAETDAASRIAVLPFTFRGDPARAYIGPGVANLVSTVLDGAGGIRTADPAAINGIVSVDESTALSPERARSIARDVGAGRWILGSVDEFGSRSTIVATLYSDGDPPVEVLRGTVEGESETEFVRLVNDLSLQFLTALGVEESPRRLESLSSGSAVALNEYLKGEDAFQAGDLVGASREFASAVEVDSTFALAWFRLAYALAWTESLTAAAEPLDRALALAGRLSERDQLLARALESTVQARGIEARDGYARVLSGDPDDVEALFGRGDARLHFGPLLGWPVDSLSAEFERVLALDPRHFEARVHLPWAAALDGGEPSVVRDAVARLAEADASGFYEPVYSALVALSSNDSVDFSASLSALGSADDLSRFLGINIGAAAVNLEGVATLAWELLARSDRLPQVRALGLVIVAHQMVGMGRPGLARERLAEASRLDPAAALEARAMLAVHPGLNTPDSEFSALRAELTGWNPDTTSVTSLGNPWLVPHDGWHPYLREYLIATLDVRLGDTAAALDRADALEARDVGSPGLVVGAALARRIRMQLHVAAGRPAEALATLDTDAMEGPDTYILLFSSGIFSESYERFLRARALLETGRTGEAIDALETMAQLNSFDLAYLAPAQLQLAELYDDLGDAEKAVEHYDRFVALWREAEEPLQARVEAAAERAAALR